MKPEAKANDVFNSKFAREFSKEFIDSIDVAELTEDQKEDLKEATKVIAKEILKGEKDNLALEGAKLVVYSIIEVEAKQLKKEIIKKAEIALKKIIVMALA